MRSILVSGVLLAHLAAVGVAFAPPARQCCHRPLTAAVPGSTRAGPLAAAAAPNLKNLPNPFKKLPWIAEKERQRQRRRFALERARLHRELGIPPEASYEEIRAATDRLIQANADNLKKKVQIEIARDKILEIRLQERIAGVGEVSSEAKRQSEIERYGGDDDEVADAKKKAPKAPSTLSTLQDLVVKPDPDYQRRQLRLWGFVTALGLALPPLINHLNRFTWLLCVGQLTFRGVSKESQEESAGIGLNFGGEVPRGGNHRKVAFVIGFSAWLAGGMLASLLVPSYMQGQRWTESVTFAIKNAMYLLLSLYLQPYKG